MKGLLALQNLVNCTANSVIDSWIQDVLYVVLRLVKQKKGKTLPTTFVWHTLPIVEIHNFDLVDKLSIYISLKIDTSGYFCVVDPSY